MQSSRRRLALMPLSSGDEASTAWLRTGPSQHVVGGRRGGRGCQDKETPLAKVAPGQAAEPREGEMLLSLCSQGEVAEDVLPPFYARC